MNIESKYLVDKFQNFVNSQFGSKEDLSDIYFVFKNYYEVINENKETRRVWFEEDLNPNEIYTKKTIVGITLWDDGSAAQWLKLNDLFNNALPFSYNWKQIGKYVISLDKLLNDSFNAFMLSIYTQLLMYIDNGNDIYLSDILFKKNSTYEILTETDFMT